MSYDWVKIAQCKTVAEFLKVTSGNNVADKPDKSRDCPTRKYFALVYDMHFDCADCPCKADCEREAANEKSS